MIQRQCGSRPPPSETAVCSRWPHSTQAWSLQHTHTHTSSVPASAVPLSCVVFIEMLQCAAITSAGH